MDGTVTNGAERQPTCARCGAGFSCKPAGGCWCAEEAYRLPMPLDAGAECLCPACLRRAAALSAAQNTPR